MKELEKFSDEQSAAIFLLKESTQILQEHNVQFVIVGGWVSYLFNRQVFGHPGTFDIDVLLDSSSLDDGSFVAASEAMLSKGYMRAAKNRFQVFRALNIRGEQILFHVDFLNERDPGDTLELQTGSGRIKSIYTPAMRVVFVYKNYRHTETKELMHINFPSEEGFIATKAVATLVKKRQRDAFDVFVTMVGCSDFDKLKKHWQILVEKDGFFHDANNCLWEAIYSGDAIDKILAVIESLNPPKIPTRQEILEKFQALLIDPSSLVLELEET